MKAKECFEAGQLQEAIDAAISEVKENPTKLEQRVLLCELLCFAGDLERADKQLDTLALQDPEAVMGVSLFRQLIRAEQARRDFFQNGRVPEVVEEPTPMQQLQLQACVELQSGGDNEPDFAKALELLEQAEELRTSCSGSCDETPFQEFRDLDDRASASLEVYTPNGKYYWIPLERLISLTMRPPQYPRDLIWRAAQIVMHGGLEGEVYIPALYAESYQADDDALKLGRATDWVGDESQPVRGLGQRCFLVGEEDVPVLSITQLQFNAASEQ